MLSQNQKQLIEKQIEIEKLKKREARYAYLGLLSEYQLHPASLIQNLDYTKLNPYQHFLFKRIVHGLNMYDKQEIEKMHWDKKRRIKKVWNKGQHAINELKQYIAYRQANKIFSIFSGPIAEGILNTPFEYVPEVRNKSTLKEMGLTYEDLIIKFMASGLLPKNFLSLKPHGNQKDFTKNGPKKQRVRQAKKAIS